MKPTIAFFDPDDEHPRETADNLQTPSTTQTPSVVYQGEIVSFSATHFHHTYTEDPLNSSLASRLLSGK